MTHRWAGKYRRKTAATCSKTLKWEAINVALLKTRGTCVGNHRQTYQVSPQKCALESGCASFRSPAPVSVTAQVKLRSKWERKRGLSIDEPPAEGWMSLQEESERTRVYLCVTVREERREVFTHISPPCRSSLAALPGWIKHWTTPTVGCKLTELPGDGWKPVKHTGLIFTTQFMDQNTHLTWRTWRSNHG